MMRVQYSGRLDRRAETASLTIREKEIVQLVVAGGSNKDIADQLFISENTVRNHLSNIFNKLGIFSRSDLNRLAVGLTTSTLPFG